MATIYVWLTVLAKRRVSIVITFLSLSALACSLGGGPAVPPTDESTATNFANAIPTLASGVTSIPSNEPQSAVIPTLASGNPANLSQPSPLPVCPPLTPRLFVGGSARVTPGDPNVVRSQPTRNNSVSAIIGQIPGGGTFVVIAGPQCNEGFYWWQVNYNGLIGWTPEGQNSIYWLEPLTTATPDCPGVPPAIMAIGQTGVVTPGDPNILRSAPAKVSSNIIGQIPAGGTFIVLSGPQCADGLRFWQVNYNGRIGWTADGQGSIYWLMPQH